MQPLRRLTIEPSSQSEPTVSDSVALASALSDGSGEDTFFEFGNFSDIPESSDSSRLSLSRAFRQNSSPRGVKPFMTPNHSPIQVMTPMNAAPPVPLPILKETPKKSKPITQSPSQKKALAKISPKPEALDSSPHSPTLSSKPVPEISAPSSEEPETIRRKSSSLLRPCDPCDDDESSDEQNMDTRDDNDEKQEASEHEDAEDAENAERVEDVEDAEDVQVGAESNSYDLQSRHQIAISLLQNAFENAMQLYEDANYEYECIRKDEASSPYCPVYEQILDNYENVFHSLANKLSDTPQPPHPELEQYSTMLLHLASLIKDKQIVP